MLHIISYHPYLDKEATYIFFFVSQSLGSLADSTTSFVYFSLVICISQ